MYGKDQTEPNDQFIIGTYSGMKFLCNLYNDFDYWMVKACPNWVTNVHDWALECLIGKYYRDNGLEIIRGEWNHDINKHGRSAYTTDKHTSLQIVEDPTK